MHCGKRWNNIYAEQGRALVVKYLFQGNLQLDRIWILVQILLPKNPHPLAKGQRWGWVKRAQGVAMLAATNGLLLQTGVLEKAIEGIRNSCCCSSLGAYFEFHWTGHTSLQDHTECGQSFWQCNLCSFVFIFSAPLYCWSLLSLIKLNIENNCDNYEDALK